ncbi:MAG: adenylate/guanylate cyclase domain-containing protein [Elusimicrobia bacterium]|nr:adenylate/guanylate cyclase domain-containing protein [Elusimicrobiota bacterium]
MAETEQEKNKKRLAVGLMTFAAIPYWLGTVGEGFAKTYMAVFGTGDPGKLHGSSSFSFGTIILLGYIWARPAMLYKRNPTPELRKKVLSRMNRVHLHAAVLLLFSTLPALALAAAFRGSLTEGIFPALSLSLFAQLCVLPIIIDWIRARSSQTMELLYEGEDLYSLRQGFSIPLALKVSLLIFSCALLPFALAGWALWSGVPPKLWSGPFTNLMLMCAVTLLMGLGVVFYGIQRPINGLIERIRRLASGDFTKTRIYYSDEIARLKAGFNEMSDGLKERQELQDTFGKYMSIEIARELIKNRRVDLGGETIEAAVMFCDIRNFTTLSESMSAAGVVEFLNNYFRYIAPAITLHNGVINKFIGDAVMAVYTPRLGSSDYAADAVRSALAMRRALAEFNASGKAPGEIRFGIGIHSGKVVAGNIGTFSRLEYTFIGDTVNSASRLQAKTKDYATDIVISAVAMEKAKGSIGASAAFQPLGKVSLKGKAEMIELYKVA